MKEQEQYIATQYKEAIDLEQELRLTREQVQSSHMEVVEARRQQVQAQREIERLSNELEEIKQLSKEKVIPLLNNFTLLKILRILTFTFLNCKYSFCKN